MARRTLDQHIEITAGVAGGRPRIGGHRITVRDIALWHVRLGTGVDEIADEYDLSLADIYAALAYYFDHRDEMDREIEESQAFVESVHQQAVSKVRQKLEGITVGPPSPGNGTES